MAKDNPIVMFAKGELIVRQGLQDAYGCEIVAEEHIDVTISGDTEAEVKKKLREALKNFAVNWLRSTEIHRVYSTRYDCPIEPEEVRRAA